jgi:hypothetical protein
MIYNSLHITDFSFMDYITSPKYLFKWEAETSRTADAEFRKYFADFLVFFPTLSIHWLFYLLIAPFLLFKTILNFSLGYRSALSAVLLYITSIGILFHIFIFFIPAKGMTNFMFILTFYFLSIIHKKIKNNEKNIGYLVPTLFSISIFIGSFYDESAGVLAFSPLLIMGTLWENKLALKRMLVFTIIPVAIHFWIITFYFPEILYPSSNAKYDYWAYVFSKQQNPHIYNIALISYFINFSNIIIPKFLTLNFLMNASNPLKIFLLSSALAVVILFYRKLSNSEKKNSLGLLIFIFIYILFCIVIMSKKSNFILGYGEYYASGFSILFSILYVMLFKLKNIFGYERISLILERTLLVFLLYIASVNSYNFIRGGIHRWEDSPFYQMLRAKFKMKNEPSQLQYISSKYANDELQKASKAWKQRSHKEIFIPSIKGLDGRYSWMFPEAEIYWENQFDIMPIWWKYQTEPGTYQIESGEIFKR